MESPETIQEYLENRIGQLKSSQKAYSDMGNERMSNSQAGKAYELEQVLLKVIVAKKRGTTAK